jgi:hypothetical protein
VTEGKIKLISSVSRHYFEAYRKLGSQVPSEHEIKAFRNCGLKAVLDIADLAEPNMPNLQYS